MTSGSPPHSDVFATVSQYRPYSAVKRGMDQPGSCQSRENTADRYSSRRQGSRRSSGRGGSRLDVIACSRQHEHEWKRKSPSRSALKDVSLSEGAKVRITNRQAESVRLVSDGAVEAVSSSRVSRVLQEALKCAHQCPSGLISLIRTFNLVQPARMASRSISTERSFSAAVSS